VRLLLASKSEARRAMLTRAGIAFETVDAALDEDAAKAGLEGAGFDPRGIAEELAQLKALSVNGTAASDLILGSDQTLELADGTMLSKPLSRAEAKAHLRALAGATHRLHSAAVLIEDEVPVWWHCETVELSMRPLGNAFLEAYLDQEYEQIRWSVGGYRIEGPGIQLFDRIEGSHFAILGMPLLPLLAYLRERGYLPR
jgi:septum formation protein